MTDTGQELHPSTSQDHDAGSSIARRRVASAVHEVCPLIRAEHGAWRSAYAAREHRCGAVQPAARLTIAKQRSLCLVPAHETCSTYLAATAAGAEALPAGSGDPAADLWPEARSMPLLLEPTRGLLAPLPGRSSRAGGGALLIGLMVVAFLVLVLARTTAPAAGRPTPGASTGAGLVVPSPISSPVATPVESASPSQSPMPSPSGGPSPTPGASPTATPGAVRRYTVRSGDTLSGIAAKYKTTVKAIAAANNLGSSRLIRPGQVLIIP